MPCNTIQNGCLYQDGSSIFTTKGLKNVGNKLSLDTVLNGHRIQFEGEDFMVIDIDESGKSNRFAAGKCNLLKINGLIVNW